MSSAVIDRRAFWAQTLWLGKTPRAYLRSLITPWNVLAACILMVGIPLIVYRFWAGIGATTNLDQAYPWGLWIGLDVASGVALAAGGYTVAAAVYIFGLEEYRPIVRPAVLTGFLGYLFVVVGLVADLGRPWNLWVVMVGSHGVTSVLFEVAWCVALYATVLFLEFSPALFEWLGWKKARAWAMRITLAMVVVGVVLSTLHQSSLGSLFLMAKGKLHPLWYSPYIPIFFFVSSIAAGLAMVIFESTISHRVFHDQFNPKKPVDVNKLTLGLGRAAAIVLFAYTFGRVIGLVDSHAWPMLASGWGAWFGVEMLGFVVLPMCLFAYAWRNQKVKVARVAAVITVLGIMLNRFNSSFIAYRWEEARYIPHWMEVMISLTIITLGVLVFRWIVNRMPVLRDDPRYSQAH